MSAHVEVPVYGRLVEVPRAAIAAELARDGAVASLALVEAIVRAAPREAAIARLLAALGPGAPATTATLTALLGLVRLDAREAAAAVGAAAAHLGPPLAASARVAHHALGPTLPALAALIDADDLVAQRAPLVLAAMPAPPPGLADVVAALVRALDRLQPVLGITAYRALLGDVGELLFRAIQRGADAAALLGDAQEGLCDRLTAELPGTPELVAARGMAWLLGTLVAGDDASRSAIERACARFRDPAFHRDCAAMLGARDEGAPAWPP